jgi:hypothetical protein
MRAATKTTTDDDSQTDGFASLSSCVRHAHGATTRRFVARVDAARRPHSLGALGHDATAHATSQPRERRVLFLRPARPHARVRRANQPQSPHNTYRPLFAPIRARARARDASRVCAQQHAGRRAEARGGGGERRGVAVCALVRIRAQFACSRYAALRRAASPLRRVRARLGCPARFAWRHRRRAQRRAAQRRVSRPRVRMAPEGDAAVPVGGGAAPAAPPQQLHAEAPPGSAAGQSAAWVRSARARRAQRPGARSAHVRCAPAGAFVRAS